MDWQEHERQMHEQLGLKSLNPIWAKLEIFIGLSAASGALIWCVTHAHATALTVVLSAALMALGGYLALAGHRSHLYQSQNKLAAWQVARQSERSTQLG